MLTRLNRRWLHPRMRSALFMLTLMLAAMLALPAPAQEGRDTGRRDPVDLAQRLLGYAPNGTLPPIPPRYEPGDTVSFRVGKVGSETPTEITAELVAVTPVIYIWIEDGLTANRQAMQQAANQLHGVYNTLRARATYRSRDNLPGSAALVFDPSDVLPLPDADDDPHLYILYTTDLADDRDAVYNPNDSLRPDLTPANFGNGHDVLLINTTPYAGAALSDPLYLSMILRGMFTMIMSANAPDQPPWLHEAAMWFMTYQLQQAPVSAADVAAFLTAPDTSLLAASTLTTRAQTLGQQLLFLLYLSQRYGPPTVLDLFLKPDAGPEPGLSALDAVLADQGILDPVSGAPVTARDAFADFVMTNALNLPFGDRRYVHQGVRLQPGQVAAVTPFDTVTAIAASEQAVNPFGTWYGGGTAVVDELVRIQFTGEPTAARLPLPADDDPGNHFYWSGRDPNRDHTLTREIDLSDADSATLIFDAWYDLPEAWNYGYVEVSTDGGATWDVLPPDNATFNNRNGVAYGPGFTGISNLLGPRPFPVVGVQMGGDGITITNVPAGGPADQAGLTAGDQIIGYDGQLWPGVPNILGLLGRYSPGDKLNLLIQRGSERLEFAVTLGAHESRVILPEPMWLEQQIDLTPYTGNEVLIRFEYVSLPHRGGRGFAIDNIAIPEIRFRDGAEDSSDGAWETVGWERINNRVPARYLVQIATSGTETSPPRVIPLIGPDDTATQVEREIRLMADEQLLIAVSGLNDDTDQPTRFDLSVEAVR